jgi:hypothetical protein
MACDRFVSLAGLLALLAVAGCTQTAGSFSGRLQQIAMGEPPQTLTDCAKSTVRRPPVVAAVTGGVPGVAIATGARLTVCAVRVSQVDHNGAEEAEAVEDDPQKGD